MLFAVYDDFMAETQAKSSDRHDERFVGGQPGAAERQIARAARGSGQPGVLTVEVARKDPAPHGKFGPTRIGGPSA